MFCSDVKRWSHSSAVYLYSGNGFQLYCASFCQLLRMIGLPEFYALFLGAFHLLSLATSLPFFVILMKKFGGIVSHRFFIKNGSCLKFKDIR